MVPKIHAKGASFKGAAAYVLHDKERAESAERVSWTETRNIAVNDPHIAWRIMAATAMDQDRLKAQAGVKNTGRKSNKHVLHFTLNWHPDQSPTKPEMLKAADEAIKALGAKKHQALIVAHNDEAHSHLHILVNRVSPEDGRHLSSSKERLKLSAWAQAYEERTGIYCEERIANNAMREAGDYVRGKKDKARHIFEVQRGAVSNDNDQTKAVLEQQRKKDAALALRGRNTALQHRRAWRVLEIANEKRKSALARDLRRKIGKSEVAITITFKPRFIELQKQQRKERFTFEAQEKNFFGRMGNRIKTARLSRAVKEGDRSGIIARTFRILSNAGNRKAYFEKAQQRARMALQRKKQISVKSEGSKLKGIHTAKLAKNRSVFFDERVKLQRSQAVETDKLKSAWKIRGLERENAFRSLIVTNERQKPGGGSEQPSIRTKAALARYAASSEFDKARQEPNREQDKSSDKGKGGRER